MIDPVLFNTLRQFRAGIGQRHPKLGVDTGIMALDGSVEVVA